MIRKRGGDAKPMNRPATDNDGDGDILRQQTSM